MSKEPKEKITQRSWVVKYKTVPIDQKGHDKDNGKEFDDKDNAELFSEKVKAVAKCHQLGIEVECKEISPGVSGILKKIVYTGVYEREEIIYVLDGKLLEEEEEE